MSEIDDGGPAFPCVETKYRSSIPGMSLRDAMAIEAMQGLMTLYAQVCGDEEATIATNARLAYAQADAMLAERKKAPK